MPASTPEARIVDALVGLGDWTVFTIRAIGGVIARQFHGRELLRVAAEVGAGSVGVIAITGAFIGMVLAVQMYHQLHPLGLDTALGAIIHMSVVRELGPVLAAVMLAGRVGTAMAAELGTMRVTDQVDALALLGVDPVRYLVAPRFLACVVMIPLLTTIANVTGVIGSSVVCLAVFRIEEHHFWEHSANYVRLWDLFVGLGKSVAFGGVLSLICCHRGFHSRSGAQGVGRAATQGFVLSFVAILAIDFVLAMLSNVVGDLFWPRTGARML